MDKAHSTRPTMSIAAMIFITALLNGCSQTSGWIDDIRKPDPAAGESMIADAPDIDQYLGELYRFAVGDPATQAEIFADAESVAKLTPGSQANLRFALLLATPGHSGSNPQQAQNLLRELVSQPELMTPAEVSLAAIYLNSAEEQVIVQNEAEAALSKGKAADRSLAAAAAENQRLRQELSEAEDKLEAITSIERSIRAQDQ